MRSLGNIVHWRGHEINLLLKDPTACYCGVALVIVIGVILIANTQAIAFCGGNEWERRRSLKFLGIFLIGCALAAFAFVEYSGYYTKDWLAYERDPDAMTTPSPTAAAGELTSAVSDPLLRHSVADESVTSPGSNRWSAPHSTASPFQAVAATPAGAPSLDLPDLPSNPYESTPATENADRAAAALKEAMKNYQDKKLSMALDEVSAVIELAPDNAEAYLLRGNIYAKQKNWAAAEADFHSAQRRKGASVGVAFNLAELQFMQKNYDVARSGFLGLKNSTMSDLALYKVFLCDLFGGNEAEAGQELAAFNDVGSNASYYFANAAWSLYHHQTDEARGWLNSAANIYSPAKYDIYSTSLVDLGYLPLPAPDNNMASLH